MPEDAPALLSKYFEGLVADFIVVLREVRRVGRALEADRRITGPRVPRLIFELYGTLRRWGHGLQCEELRQSAAGDDAALRVAREALISYEPAKKLAAVLALGVKDRLGHLFTHVDEDVILFDPDVVTTAEKKRRGKERQAATFHMAAVLDGNECGMEWLPLAQRHEYVSILYKGVATDMLYLAEAFGSVPDPLEVYVSAVRNVHTMLVDELDANGRQKVNAPLSWWARLSAMRGEELISRSALLDAVKITPAARAYLSVPASSASCERLFSDAGTNDSYKRQSQSMAVHEMQLVVRSYCRMRLGMEDEPEDVDRASAPALVPVVQTDLLSTGASAYVALATEIANSIMVRRAADAAGGEN